MEGTDEGNGPSPVCPPVVVGAVQQPVGDNSTHSTFVTNEGVSEPTCRIFDANVASTNDNQQLSLDEERGFSEAELATCLKVCLLISCY